MGSTLAEETLKYSRFFLRSSSFKDHTPVIKVTCSTIQPWCCVVLVSADFERFVLCLCFAFNSDLVGKVGHALKFQQSDHSYFGCRGHFECNTVWSLVPEPIMSDLFMWNSLLRISSVWVNGRHNSVSLVSFHNVYSLY